MRIKRLNAEVTPQEKARKLLGELDPDLGEKRYWLSSTIGRSSLNHLFDHPDAGPYFELANVGLFDKTISAYPRKSYFMLGDGRVVGVLETEIYKNMSQDEILESMRESAEFEIENGLSLPAPQDTLEAVKILENGWLDTA